MTAAMVLAGGLNLLLLQDIAGSSQGPLDGTSVISLLEVVLPGADGRLGPPRGTIDISPAGARPVVVSGGS